MIRVLLTFILIWPSWTSFGQKMKNNDLTNNSSYELFDSKNAFDRKELFNEVIVNKSSSIYANAVLFNSDTTKLLAFCSCLPNSIGFKGSEVRKMDTVVILGDHINSCTYVISGVLHDTNWYLRKHSRVYRNSSLYPDRIAFMDFLKDQDFYKKNNSSNEEFWNISSFFRKVEIENLSEKKLMRLKNKIKKTYSPGTLNSYKHEYKYKLYLREFQYNGLYEIVADSLIAREESINKQFEKKIFDDVFKPFLNDYLNCNMNYKSYRIHSKNNAAPIYPKHKEYVIFPVLLTDNSNNHTLHFFVAIRNDKSEYQMFKWNYFKPTEPKYIASFGATTVEQMSSITIWNYSYDYIYDENFFDKFIKNSEISYLSEICTSANNGYKK